MARLEDLQAGTRVMGIAPSGIAEVKAVEWYGEQCVQVMYVDETGKPDHAVLYRADEPRLKLEERGRLWSFDADGDLLRLVSEAHRIHLAWLFDPYLAISTSTIDPLPHQISAVYEEMLPRQPLRFLLADDPGAGKTIMAGLFIKELLVRGDMQRCLIISPGSLTEQWQDELKEKFDLDFEILTRDMIQASRTSNPFEHKNCLIARLDQLARNEDIQERLRAAPEWDLVVCDEAHRMSAHFFGGEIKETKRYKLGKNVGSHCRNFLLMTATPHNGKEEDFQLFLGLLDGDRFAGRFRDGVHTADPGDMMRRLVKEDLTEQLVGVVSQRDRLRARQERNDARAEFAALRASLGVVGRTRGAEYTLTAPIAGVVTRRTATLGTFVDGDAVLFEVADASQLWAEIEIPEDEVARVAAGQPVVVTLDALGARTFEGTLDYLAPEIDPHTRTALGRVPLANPEGMLRANMFGRACVQVPRNDPAVVVPRDAIQRARGATLVFVREAPELFEARRVEVLDRPADPDQVEVRGRIEAGDEVVIGGAFLLRTETVSDSIGAGCCEGEE